jgi:hypothetical protein
LEGYTVPADQTTKRLRERLQHPYVWLGLLLSCLVGAMVWLGTGCGGWDPREPFMRNAPEVDEAIAEMDAGNYGQAAQLLTDYLGTGKCKDGEIDVSDNAWKKADGVFDLGLVLFSLGEKYGARFGEEEQPAEGTMEPPEIDERRASAIDCALDVVNVIAGDKTLPADLRARAHYLSGNLSFLRREYQKAVDAYDLALQLIPGVAEDADSDPIGRDAAWNRAIALRRLQENPDAGQPDAEPDGGGEGEQGDGGGQDEQSQDQSGDQEQDQDAGGDEEQEQDAGGDEQEEPQPQSGDGDEEEEQQPDMGPIAEAGEEDPEQTRMRLLLEELEEAPTYQQEEAKRARSGRAPRVLEDK